ncbi:electron transfer flavoprotein subunit alpha/FixB family protein [candidate division KSB1 bacterium]|nr:electron transfer flavoprotein subunit alpha/FixB family protein [candidate division KSB1 bacterium]
MSTILVFCPARDGLLRPVCKEIVSAAKRISGDLNARVTAVTFGEVSDAATLGAFGASTVVQLTSPALGSYSTEGYAQAASEFIQSESPLAVFFAATARGKDLAPRVAARVGRPLFSDCTELKVEGGQLHAQRPMYAGKVILWAKINGGFGVLTLRPKAFLPAEVGGSAAVESRAVNVDAAKVRAQVVEEKATSGGELDVSEADIVVSGGRGLKAAEHFKLIEDLAHTLGGAVGASRAVVDAGWRSHHEQVGQTGKVVSPTLYIAIAISGAVQHLAGMTTSRVIVAINKDADAPIFKVATYGIVGDAFEIVPKLTEELRKVVGH